MIATKKLFVIILAILFLVNIVAAAFIFIDIQVLSFPQMTVRIDAVEINTDEVIFHHDIQVYNPNSFDMILKDVHIVAKTTEGQEVTNLTIEGGTVAGQAHQNYSADDHIIMKGNLSGLLSSTITGVAGFNLFGIITKTIPLKMTVLISLKEALSKIAIPGITLRAEFGNISRSAVNLTMALTISNQNPFGMFVKDFHFNVTTETGAIVGSFSIPGADIPAERTTTIKGTGSVLIVALNAKRLDIDLQADAGAMIAGLNKSLPISAQVEIAIPNLEDLVPQDKPLELSLDIDLSRVRGGFNGNMTLEVLNPTKVPFYVTDIVVMYYGVKNNKKYFVAEGPMGAGELVPGATTYFYGNILLSYSKLLNFSGRGFLPDKVFAQLRAKVTLPGVTIYVPVAIGSYIDFHLLRPNQ